MQDENLMKMSQIATPPLMDTHMANILICCLLDHLKKPVTPTQLYEIAVETEIINYFFYQESITYLQKNGSLQLKQDENGQVRFLFRISRCRLASVSIHSVQFRTLWIAIGEKSKQSRSFLVSCCI